MEIHYIWINSYGHFKNQGINLSSRYFIKAEIKVTGAKKSGHLFIKHNPNFIENFFEKKQIKNVSAIIGKNGAGKSSILNYIKSHFPEGLAANTESDVIVYTIDDEKEYVVAIPDEIELDIIDETGLFSKIPYNANSLHFSTRVSDADYIYYSFFIDYTSELSDWGGLKNISTSALLVQGRKRIIEENISLDTNIKVQDYSTDLDYLIGDEIAKAVEFLISSDKSSLPFRRPDSLYISVDKTDRAFFENPNSKNDDVIKLISQLDRKNSKEEVINKEVNNILIALLVNLFITERKYSTSMTFSHNLKLNRGEKLRAFIIRFFSDLKDMRFEHGNEKIPYAKYQELSKLVPAFIKYLDELVKQQFITAGISGQSGIRFHLTEKSDEAFRKFMKFYLSVKGLTPFLSFRWRSLSTGEQSYLSFVSRFHHLKHHEIGSDDLKKNLIILIDEGDAGYHPEWQRRFFKNTIEFLSSLFNNHQIQLIFTANAPFLTSDLPKYCISFIERKADGLTIIHDKENNRSETFGSNIHTLFSDAFYMEGALIGEFAKHKIDLIIKYLNDKNVTKQNISYKKTISLIGEPILRNKLQSMWNAKFGLTEELENLLKRVNEIQARLAENNNLDNLI